MTERLRLRLDLMLTFMRIGFFTFGGGYAMIPLIEETCVNKKGWITADEMVMIAAVAESTPGPISINCATYVGYRQAGFSGALWATFGMVLPSFLVIYLISMFLENFLEITVVANAFRGIQIAVGLLILDAGISVSRKLGRGALNLLLTAGAFGTMLLADIFSWGVSALAILLLAAAASLAACLWTGRRKEG
mgnify:FL=1